MESREPLSPALARAGLDDVSAARERLADRITSPWWYRVGAALSTASLFVAAGLVAGRPTAGTGTESASTALVALGAVVAPAALMWALSRTTGVRMDRYAQGMGRWTVQVFALLALGVVLQVVLDVPHALAGAGVLGFALTYDRERRIDRTLRERVRAGA